MGLHRSKGQLIIDFIFDDAYSFSEGLAPVVIDSKLGYIDKTGKMVIPAKYDYDSPYNYSEGLIPVIIDGKIGYINDQDEILIEPVFDMADSFNEGLARISVSGKTGFIYPLFILSSCIDRSM